MHEHKQMTLQERYERVHKVMSIIRYHDFTLLVFSVLSSLVVLFLFLAS